MKNFFKNSYLVILLLLIAIALPFIIEQRVKETKSKIPTIVFWQYWSGSEKEALTKLVEDFNRGDHGFKVQMQSISMPRKKILLSIIAKVAPDLIHLDGDMLSDFALRNALREIVLDDNEKSKFIPIYLKILNIKNKQWGLPLMPTCEAMHSNKGLLAKHGLKEARTLMDIESWPLQNSSMNFVAWMPSWPPWSSRFSVLLFNGSWADGENITANSEANIRAWSWLQNKIASKMPQDKIAAFTEGYKAYQSPDNPFYAGRIGMENSGVWEYNLAKRFAPKMRVTVSAFPHDESAFPQCRSGDASCAPTLVSVDALAIPRGAAHPDLALKFMRWLLETEHIEYLAKAQGKFSVLKEFSPSFIQGHPNPHIEIFIKLANSPNAVYFPQLACVQSYRREISSAYSKLLRLELSPREALNQVQNKMLAICK